jgi:pimeloyl-ACP methyl ester carboxylesterase
VVFGVLPATGERRGMFVTAVGGPGGSGLAVADSYTAAFDPSIPSHFDVVFFDQRGVRIGRAAVRRGGDGLLPGRMGCHYARRRGCSGRHGHTFAAIASPRWATRAAFLGTEQAIEDLEALRQAMGDEQFWLYGNPMGPNSSRPMPPRIPIAWPA